MSVMFKRMLRIIAPVNRGSRVWQRHSALLRHAAKQHGRVG